MILHSIECSETMDLQPCEVCGHAACWHRLEDSKSPTEPGVEFPCLGESFKGCEVLCPDFKGLLLVEGREVTIQ